MSRAGNARYNRSTGGYRLKPHLHEQKHRYGTPKFRHRAQASSARHSPLTRAKIEDFFKQMGTVYL